MSVVCSEAAACACLARMLALATLRDHGGRPALAACAAVNSYARHVCRQRSVRTVPTVGWTHHLEVGHVCGAFDAAGRPFGRQVQVQDGAQGRGPRRPGGARERGYVTDRRAQVAIVAWHNVTTSCWGQIMAHLALSALSAPVSVGPTRHEFMVQLVARPGRAVCMQHAQTCMHATPRKKLNDIDKLN